MLVVHDVEGEGLNHPQKMWEFETHDAVWFQKPVETPEEVVDVGHMGEHVVGDHKVGLQPLSRQFPTKPLPEEALNRFDPPSHGGLCGKPGGFDSVAGDAPFLDILKEVPVVGRDFHHPAVASQTESLYGGVHIVASGLQQCL